MLSLGFRLTATGPAADGDGTIGFFLFEEVGFFFPFSFLFFIPRKKYK